MHFFVLFSIFLSCGHSRWLLWDSRMPDFPNILTSTIHRNNMTFLTLPLFKHLNVSLDLVAPTLPWDLVFHLSALTPIFIFNSPTFHLTGGVDSSLLCILWSQTSRLVFSSVAVSDLWQGWAHGEDWVVWLGLSRFDNIYHLSHFWVALGCESCLCRPS